jgi:hypothetical protein
VLSISGGKTEPFLEVIFRRIMMQNKNAPKCAQWVWGIDWRQRIFLYHIMMSNRGWLQPSSCPWLDRFSAVSGDGPDFGQILISPSMSIGHILVF